jgi:hypothetical protein
MLYWFQGGSPPDSPTHQFSKISVDPAIRSWRSREEQLSLFLSRDERGRWFVNGPPAVGGTKEARDQRLCPAAGPERLDIQVQETGVVSWARPAPRLRITVG